MRLPANPHRASGDINMTPMIDVVFQLLIFFLVASHLSRQETQVELTLPAAKSGREEGDAQGPRATINVPVEGSILLAAQPIELDELQRRLRAENARHDGKLQVRIRADRRVVYRRVEPVLRACAQANVWNLTFAVVEEL